MRKLDGRAPPGGLGCLALPRIDPRAPGTGIHTTLRSLLDALPRADTLIVTLCGNVVVPRRGEF
jgi:hypothetical protein